MTSTKKIRVAVLYGGRSGEHEISLQSAASVIRNLDKSRYEIIPIAIDKGGRWLLNDIKLLQDPGKTLPVFKDAPPVVLSPSSDGHEGSLIPVNGVANFGKAQKFDVVFPVMHGPLCEDGTVQGLLELADVPYVGCAVLASAVGMDKEVSKRLARDAGLPIVPYVAVRPAAWSRDRAAVVARIKKETGFPVFVKPSNMGSSVGVHKVKEEGALDAALKDAFKYDLKVLVEKAVNAREIEVAVLENPDASGAPLVTVAGEVVPTHEFYSYEAKYLDENGAKLMIPANLDEKQMARARELGGAVFTALECEGMARIDMFLDKDTGGFYFNEINTIPGFTSISMYPKLWEATGVPYAELLTRLIDLALARHGRKHALAREYKP